MEDYIVALDFETYSDVDLRKHGVARYVRSPHFEPLIAHVVSEHGPTQKFDFVLDDPGETFQKLRERLAGRLVLAHNVAFEYQVLHRIGIEIREKDMLDTAVIAAAAGADRHLANAAAQLLGSEKLDAGAALIRLFCVPGKYQEKNNSDAFDPQVVHDNLESWSLFHDYCGVDAQLSMDLYKKYRRILPPAEKSFATVTLGMNMLGWPVDLDLVRQMQVRYHANLRDLEAEFRAECDAHELNLNSHQQLQNWCLERGVKARSFDEENVARLQSRLAAKLETMSPDEPRYADYRDVLRLMETKQALGGSSLRKLQTILDTVVEIDDRRGVLYDQYKHLGASQTWRTSGQSAQMQNLKRLSADIINPADFYNPHLEFTNEQLAQNLRQVFTASHPDGVLIVGDFSSVESRGLAYLAGEEWKLQAYRDGKDLYKVLAAKIYHTTYELVTKGERNLGKTGELSCGYGAGAVAVADFAAKMGMPMSQEDAAELVRDWRSADPMIVELWAQLQDMLWQAVNNETAYHQLPYDGLELIFTPVKPPESLRMLNPKAVSVMMQITKDDTVYLSRVFHGCHRVDNEICFYKPSSRVTGDLWSADYMNPKTKRRTPYKLYGGKLAGILTQSLCRELFFDSLKILWHQFKSVSNVQVIGQFHDEIVLDWRPQSQPGDVSLEWTIRTMEGAMTSPGFATSFPLSAEIKSDYRYIK